MIDTKTLNCITDLARSVQTQYQYHARARGMLAAWKKAAEAAVDAHMQRMVQTTDPSLTADFVAAVVRADITAFELVSEACTALARSLATPGELD